MLYKDTFKDAGTIFEKTVVTGPMLKNISAGERKSELSCQPFFYCLLKCFLGTIKVLVLSKIKSKSKKKVTNFFLRSNVPLTLNRSHTAYVFSNY